MSKEIIHQIEMELVNHRWINSTKDKYEQMHSRRFPNNIVTRPKDLSQAPHIYKKRFSNVLARFFYINNATIISLHFLSCPTNKFLTITLTSFTLCKHGGGFAVMVYTGLLQWKGQSAEENVQIMTSWLP